MHVLTPTDDKDFWIGYITYIKTQAEEASGTQPLQRPSQSGGFDIRRYIPPLSYVDNSWKWRLFSPTTTTTIVHPAPSAPQKSKEELEAERKREEEKQAQYMGGVVALISGLILGFVMKSYSLARSECSVATQALELVQLRSTVILDPKDIKQAEGLFNNYLQIQQTKYKRARNYTIISSAVALSAMALAIGGFTRHSWLMTTGKISLLISSFFGLFSLAWHWQDSTAIKQIYKKIQGPAAICLNFLSTPQTQTLPPSYYSTYPSAPPS